MLKHRIAVFAIFTFLTSLLFLACPNEQSPEPQPEPIPEPQPSALEGKLLILQAYGNGPEGSEAPKGVSHSFVEIFNKSEEIIDLDGLYLHYADSQGSLQVEEDWAWERLALKGSIPARASFLILGAAHEDTSKASYTIEDESGDMNSEELILSRRGFKLALIEGDTHLEVQNPFDSDGEGGKVDGYIDGLGALNDTEKEKIFGFETKPARNSASEAVRRISAEDTDNNNEDFASIRYNDIDSELLEVRHPRTASETVDGWDPFQAPEEPEEPEEPVSTERLLIWQVFGNGGESDVDISHSFVELYNNSENDINLDNFSLQYAAGTRQKGEDSEAEDMAWKLIELSGEVPAKTSFLIRGKQTTFEGQLLTVAEGDVEAEDFVLSNRSFKVVLLSNKSPLTVSDPFTANGGEPVEGYVDMLGAINDGKEDKDAVDASETAPYEGITKNQAARRKDLSDSNDNASDFISSRFKEKDNNTAFIPRNTAAGSWNPLTGEEL